MLGSMIGLGLNAAKMAATAQLAALGNSNKASVNINNAASHISNLSGIAQENSAFNAAEAEKQRDWSAEQSANAMRFNAGEAAKSRDWTKMMSNTAHQREVNDLLAAGLNPVLSAMNGNGAAVTSGATASGVVGSGSKADADTSTSAAIANLLGSILSAQTQLHNANINARTQEAVADKYNAMSKIVAEINAAAGIKEAGIHAGASRYAAEQSFAASKYSTDHTKYGMIENAISGVIDRLFGDTSGSSSSGKDASGKSGNIFYDDPTWDKSMFGKFWNKHFRKDKK